MSKLEALNLAKAYGKRSIVKDVSISVNTGQVVGLLGPNGAGKTTCFYMVVGLIASDKGKVILDGQDLSYKSMHIRAQKGLGYLPQEASIFRKLSVADNIMAILQTRSDLNKQARKEQLESLLNEFNIQHIRHSLGMSLSGGERRRVEVARALASNPKFILLDEPFAGVDPISVGEIKNIIKHLSAKGIGILITDHNVRDALDICEVSYIVSEGYILTSGDSQTVLSDPRVKQVYLGDNFNL